MTSVAETHPTGLDSDHANQGDDALHGQQRTRLNRRQVLTRGLGAAAAAKLVSVSGFAESVSAAPAPSAKKAPLASQSGTVTLRFMRFAGPQWEFDTIFVEEFMEAEPEHHRRG